MPAVAPGGKVVSQEALAAACQEHVLELALTITEPELPGKTRLEAERAYAHGTEAVVLIAATKTPPLELGVGPPRNGKS
jgi:hypothetical protein